MNPVTFGVRYSKRLPYDYFYIKTTSYALTTKNELGQKNREPTINQEIKFLVVADIPAFTKPFSATEVK